MMANGSDVQISFGASLDDLDQGLADIKEKIGGLAAPLQDLQSAFSQNDATAAAMRAVDAEIKILQDGLNDKKQILAAEVSAHQITQGEKFSALEAETQQEYTAQLALLQQELGIDNLRLLQRQSILDKIEELEAEHSSTMVKYDAEAIAADQKQWESYFSGVESAFNSQLRGLLSGTTSWATASKNILGSLLIKFIETVEKMVVQWAAGELAQTTATTTGAALRTAASTAGASAGVAANLSTMVASILGSAAETFAGIFGFLAPIMGPAALGPAAAGQATVAAVASAVPSFDIGSWSVPSTTLAMVHAGETIIPAGPAQSFRDVMSGRNSGGSPSSAGVTVNHSTNFTVNAVDSEGVKTFFKNNSKSIMAAVNHGIKTGTHLGFAKLTA